MNDLTPQEIIEQKIYLIRGEKVMIDRDLAMLYNVPTFRLNEQVKRNKKRFPEDFMFRLTKEENNSLTSQIAMSNMGRGGRRTLPYAFTDYGIAMLSSVLNSERAAQVNIQIIRTFIKMRKILATHKELLQKIENMERKYDKQFRIVFDIIRGLNEPPAGPKRKIGFRP